MPPASGTGTLSTHALAAPRCDRALENARPKIAEPASMTTGAPELYFESLHGPLHKAGKAQQGWLQSVEIAAPPPAPPSPEDFFEEEAEQKYTS